MATNHATALQSFIACRQESFSQFDWLELVVIYEAVNNVSSIFN